MSSRFWPAGLRWLFGIGCLLAAGAAAAQVEVLDAWYGTPTVQSKTIGGVAVAERIRKNVQGNVLVIPANMNAFFGGDPVPNQAKGVMVTVRVQGQTANLAQNEGKEFRYPGVAGRDYFVYVPPAAATAPGAATVEVLDAWYGTPALQSKTIGGVPVVERIRKNMQGNVVVVPANMNAFFGGDPVPNQQKGVVITLRSQGQTANLAQIEGKEFRYPGVSPRNYYVYVAPPASPAAATTAEQSKPLASPPPAPPTAGASPAGVPATTAAKPVPPTPVILPAPAQTGTQSAGAPVTTQAPRSAVPPTPIIVAAPPPKSAEQLKFEADQQKLAKEAADKAAAGKAAEDVKAKNAAAAAAAAKVNETNAATNIGNELASAFGILQAATDTNIANLSGAPSQPSLLKTLTSTTPTAGGKPSIQTTSANQNAAQDVFEKKLNTSRTQLAALSNPSGNSVVEGFYTRYEALTKRFADELDKAEAATDNLTIPVALQTPAPLICPTSNGAANAEFCWRDSTTRGVGTVPTDCPAGTDRIGLFCYAQCKPGMKRVGFDCHSACPAGWRDDGLFCRQAEYGRGVGYPWKGQDGLSNAGMMSRCESAQGAGKCEMWGAIAYPKCKEGWEPFGCCLCRPKTTPVCGAVNLGGGFDLSCSKKIEIGSPKIGRCPAGKEMDAGLCYRACPLGYDGVGPVCWAKAPTGWSACGMGAVNGGSADCAKKISSQVTAVVDAGIKIATAVATAGAPIGPANAARLAQLREQFANLKKLKKAAAPVGLVVVVTNLEPDPGLPEFANLANNLEKKIDAIVTDEDIARLTMEIAAATLPSGGITGAISAGANAIAAYTYPKCSKYFQPGACTPAPLPKTTEKKTQVQISLEEQAANTLKVERKLAMQEQCKICRAPFAQLDLSTYCNSLDYCAKTCDLPAEYEVSLLNKGATAAEYCRAVHNLLDYPNCERIVTSYCPADVKSCAALINKSCGAPPIVAVSSVDRPGVPTPPAGGWPPDCPETIDASKPYTFYGQHKCMQLSVVSGDAQQGQGDKFADLKVRLRWRNGTPVPGYPIYFGCVPVVTPNDINGKPSGNACQVNNDLNDNYIRKPVLTGADGIATTTVHGQALAFGAPLRVVAEAGELSGQRIGRSGDIQFPGNRIDFIRFTSYEWPPDLVAVGPVGDRTVNNYVDQKMNASFITYFNLILLKR